jgi:hypothetical protein
MLMLIRLFRQSLSIMKLEFFSRRKTIKKVTFASKLVKGTILLFLSFIILSCNQTLSEETLREPCRNEELNSPIISREVAILIAKGVDFVGL